MKKITMLVLIWVSFIGLKANNLSLDENKINTSQEVNFILNRIHEIQVMDKSQLGVGEKRILKKEVQEISQRLKILEPGIYLSVGALIVILLLLLILF
jgi:heterodisulfide reductase subunit A-like polyferredoxin